MNTRHLLIASLLLACAIDVMAQDKKPADTAAKPAPVVVPAQALPAAAAKASAVNAADKPAQPQSQSLRAAKKKTGGGQTEDDLYVGVK